MWLERDASGSELVVRVRSDEPAGDVHKREQHAAAAGGADARAARGARTAHNRHDGEPLPLAHADRWRPGLRARTPPARFPAPAPSPASAPDPSSSMITIQSTVYNRTVLVKSGRCAVFSLS